jgi:hypothetical protein
MSFQFYRVREELNLTNKFTKNTISCQILLVRYIIISIPLSIVLQDQKVFFYKIIFPLSEIIFIYI